ncbi:ABC transporter permease subunit [Devosia rhodophyticola]|uniref:ABC transporter permease subunit n=1 Tax=Devosia rhodophyticola TaxID=3026423 RepID=A0ABY7YU67_9HYPH|nr:ABC transporter permease subunit [Devosia rhodophyticola]WDR04494.1 ABC transporter permease subunit [Devosia rhodophyticola]
MFDFVRVYLNFKIAASDGICGALAPISPDLFVNACPRFFDGFFVTLELLLLSSVLGFLIAVAVVLARVSSSRFLSIPAHAYIYVFRGTPLLVQLWVLYYGLGSMGAEGLGPLWPFFKEGWWVGLLTLTLNTAAYVAEILRGGIQNLPHGQIEAAEACGMTWSQRMRRIIFPQAIRIAWPAYGNEVILLMKASALVSTITVMDLMGQTRTIFSRSYDLSIFLYGAALYLVLAGLLTLGLRLVEARMTIPSFTQPKSPR